MEDVLKGAVLPTRILGDHVQHLAEGCKRLAGNGVAVYNSLDIRPCAMDSGIDREASGFTACMLPPTTAPLLLTRTRFVMCQERRSGKIVCVPMRSSS
jgi:hypothetical protein